MVPHSRRTICQRPDLRRNRQTGPDVPKVTRTIASYETVVIILDTDVLSIVQRADGQEYDILVERLDSADDEVAVSIVSFEEQMRGWLAFIARAKSSNQ